MRTLPELENEVRFTGATLLTNDEEANHLETLLTLNPDFIGERAVVTGVKTQTLIRMPDYKVRRQRSEG